jgi:hypothetical protein
MLSVKVQHKYGATWHHQNEVHELTLEYLELGERVVLALHWGGGE